MGMTGDTTTSIAIICPSCGERYDSPERVGEILRNSGFCANLTCLEDLSHLPIDAIGGRRKKDTSTRRSTDRRAV